MISLKISLSRQPLNETASEIPNAAVQRSADQLRTCFASLTGRQREVCQMMVEGMVNKKIAQTLGTSINTVKTHRNDVFRKMKATSLLDLVRKIDLLQMSDRPSVEDRGDAIAPLAAPPSPPALLQVIVVEDNLSLRQTLVEGLANLGHQVAGAQNGDDLDQFMARMAPDIVLLDIGLGQGLEDGFAITARLRQQHRCGIIMVTARGDLDSRVQGLDQGADAYMVKPVDFRELSSVMQSVARRLNLSVVAHDPRSPDLAR